MSNHPTPSTPEPDPENAPIVPVDRPAHPIFPLALGPDLPPAPDVPPTRVIGGRALTHDWTPVAARSLARTRIFHLRSERIQLPGDTGRYGRFIVCETPRWVNVVAITTSREIVLVRQFRVGVRRPSLEIPGGLVDPGEDPAVAATRELREETGFEGDPPRLLGWQEPNPAIQDNITYTYLITNCSLTKPQELDPGEEILIELAAVEDVDALVLSGAIRHALVVTALYHFKRWQPQV